MVMEPTVFFFSLVVIANIKSSSQNENYTAPKGNSLEKYSELIDQLLAENAGNATPTTVEDTTTIQSPIKGSELESTTGKPTWLESTETVANTIKNPDINTINATEFDVTSNDTKIEYIVNFPSRNKTVEPVADENEFSHNINQFTSPRVIYNRKLDDPKILQYLTDNINSNPNVDDHGNEYNTAGTRYLNSASVENSNKVPWYNSRERLEAYEYNDDLPNIFNSRRSFSGNNNTLGSVIENQKDGGLGVVLKEEIVFEIEDDKPPAISKPPIRPRLHNTTPKPTVLLLKPKMKGKNVNTTYFPFSPSTVLTSQRVLVNKSMYEQMKKINYLNVSSHQKLLTPKRMPQMTSAFENNFNNIRPFEITRRPENNIKLQTEFNKLNDKINALQEFLNKTLEKENKTKRHRSQHLPKMHKHNDTEFDNVNENQSKAVSLLRTGYPDSNQPILRRTVVNRIVNNVSPPLISNTNQGIMENILPGRNIITQPALLRQNLIEPRLQRHLILLELANLAKLKHDIQLISSMRKRPKYVLPVYRRRVILKPLGRIL